MNREIFSHPDNYHSLRILNWIGLSNSTSRLMKKVLIPTDFSDNAFNAICYSLELLKYDKSEIFIVHSYADEVYEDKAIKARALFDEVKEKVHKRTTDALNETLSKMKLRSPNPRHVIKSEARFGSLIDVVNDMVEEENIDMVIMGSLGKDNRKEVTFGSETLQVAKYVKCPVLVIPAGYTDISPSNFLFPTDYLIPYKKRELKLLDTLVKNFAGRLQVMYVSPFDKLSFRQEDNQEFLESCLDETHVAFIKEKGDDVLEVIKSKLDNDSIDMLVMVNSRHSYLENVLYTSKIDTLGLEIKIPFLILQNLSR